MSILQRAYPSADLVEVLNMHLGHARYLYNLGLEQRGYHVKGQALRLNAAQQQRELAEARKEFDWLRAGSSSVQQAALRDLDRAFRNFFARRAGYPRFKKRHRGRESFVVRDLVVRRLNKRWGEVVIPKSATRLRFRVTVAWDRIAAAKSARVTFGNGVWHVSFVTAPPEKMASVSDDVLGVDRGVANSIATSDGEFATAPGLSQGQQRRAKALQRKLARQRRGSRAREETKRQLGKLRLVDRNRKTEWVEQTTTRLARAYTGFALEKLPIKNMVKKPAPRPDPDQPGRFLPNGRAAKRGLARGIMSSCWGEFARRLADKSSVVFVPAANTSRTCVPCGHISAGNRQSQAVFRCENCDHEAHADTNAAINIRNRAFPEPEGIGGSGAEVSHSGAAPTSGLIARNTPLPLV
ncbi:RNA-guided endonuclease InsQ/TnpB family protein [Nocardia concava]|uniref:RNA-guided endonuclease InsQ/TnpB family protein n=1 Tax=Nocardia concava TaxID=257281 RepID=UPI000315F715|nr:RNA-guided endonuclease TnpB family protein [Nocardia concava]